MIRRAEVGEEDAILEFLAPRAHSSMFLRSNLLEHGLAASTAPRASTYWLHIEGGNIKAVFARSNSAYLMCQCPDIEPDVWRGFARQITGMKIAGITGEVPQIKRALSALGFPEEQIGLNRVEPFYHLDLKALPPEVAQLRKPIAADADFLMAWFRQYLLETGIEQDNAELTDICIARAQRAVVDDATRLLLQDGQPIAMTGINARTQETVQIGGVYVPDHFRGQGLAGQAVAAHLKELKATGITEAVLFAASTAAARAYEKIGFKHVGYYQMVLLKDHYRYGGPA